VDARVTVLRQLADDLADTVAGALVLLRGADVVERAPVGRRQQRDGRLVELDGSRVDAIVAAEVEELVPLGVEQRRNEGD
jgi:hypothetical protein